MIKQSFEREPLCQEEGTHSLDSHDLIGQPGRASRDGKCKRFVTRWLMIAYLPLIALYLLLAVKVGSLAKKRGQVIDLNLFPSLAGSWPAQTEDRIYRLKVEDSEFIGKPSAVIDEAWHDLLEGSIFRASKADLEFFNVTSLALQDGSGYATELFMTHELHCLKLIRKWKYKEYYYGPELEEQGSALAELDGHVDHCIETLRQGIMCRGDVSLVTYSYIEGTSNVTARSCGSHRCVNTKSLMSWVKARSVNVFQPGVLVPPGEL